MKIVFTGGSGRFGKVFKSKTKRTSYIEDCSMTFSISSMICCASDSTSDKTQAVNKRETMHKLK